MLSGITTLSLQSSGFNLRGTFYPSTLLMLAGQAHFLYASTRSVVASWLHKDFSYSPVAYYYAHLPKSKPQRWPSRLPVLQQAQQLTSTVSSIDTFIIDTFPCIQSCPAHSCLSSRIGTQASYRAVEVLVEVAAAALQRAADTPMRVGFMAGSREAYIAVVGDSSLT